MGREGLTGAEPCGSFRAAEVFIFRFMVFPYHYRISNYIGGETKYLYEIGAIDPLSEQDGLHSKDSNSPRETSNFMAKTGFDKAVNCVFPDTTDEGYCCRLETKLFGMQALGLKLNVLVAGCLFVGSIIKPVRTIREPLKKMNHGIPFTGKPKAIRFDYRYDPGENRIKSIYNFSPVEGSIDILTRYKHRHSFLFWGYDHFRIFYMCLQPNFYLYDAEEKGWQFQQVSVTTS